MRRPRRTSRADASATASGDAAVTSGVDAVLQGLFRTHGMVLPPLRRRFGRYRTRDVDAMLADLAVRMQAWETDQEESLRAQVADMAVTARRDLDRLAREAREVVANAERDLARVKLMIEELAWLPPVPPQNP